MKVPALTPFQLAHIQDPGQKRWRYYPDLTATLTSEEIRKSMDEYVLYNLTFINYLEVQGWTYASPINATASGSGLFVYIY